MSYFINWLHKISGTHGLQNIENRGLTAASKTTRTLWTSTAPGTKHNEKIQSELEGKRKNLKGNEKSEAK
jgi:hypothetical protein